MPDALPSADPAPTIIIRRPKIVAASAHHGGAWKVAYADFVTAMMAFFLLMWLLNATTEDQRKGLADYFNPSIPIAAVSGGGAGALGGDDVASEDQLPVSKRPQKRTLTQRLQSSPVPGTTSPRNQDLSPAETALAETLSHDLKAGSDILSEHMVVHTTPEGIVIELTDRDSRPLFQLGSAQPSPRLKALCDVVADVIKDLPHRIAVVGHTDNHAFQTPRAYSNWELSTDRAHAARRWLVASGALDDRIENVSGKADTAPLVQDAADARNRRISITLLHPS